MRMLNSEEMRQVEGGTSRPDVITSVYYGWYVQNNKWKWGKIYNHKHWNGRRYINYKTYGHA